MAGEWLKMECATPDKPEVFAITSIMKWDDPDLTVGKLFRVWRWFDQQTTDGNAKLVTSALLDRIAGVTGFAAAMQSVGWLVVTDDGVSLPNFDNHNGQSAKSRSETAKRVANHRAKKTAVDEGTYQRLTLPRPIKSAVFARDGNACVYCGRKSGEYTPPENSKDGILHVDHVVPVSRGGLDELSNLVSACGPCNMFKSDRTPDECGMRWPLIDGKPAGNAKPVTTPLPREEKKREDRKSVGDAKRRTQLPEGFTPNETGIQCARAKGISVDVELPKFTDFHRAKGSVMLDWQAAFRTWIGNARTFNRVADVAAVTVPSKPGRDPALEKIEADRARAAAPTLEQLAALAALRKPQPQGATA